jgi:hypothetical protein
LNRKLLALNLVLVALASYGGVQWRNRWLKDQARARAELRHPLASIPPPPFTPDLAPTAALPANYINVAQKDLFDKSRNPDVPVDPPPPPPPPVPMPPLPVYHGAMNLGDGPVAIMSVNATARHQGIKPGEAIGPFKLVDLTRDDLTLEWNGQMIRKQLYELQSRSMPVDQTAATGRTEAPPPAAKPAEPPQPAKGPGELTTFGSKICYTSDPTPDGTVVDGFKKVSITGPFGRSCVWDPVGK